MNPSDTESILQRSTEALSFFRRIVVHTVINFIELYIILECKQKQHSPFSAAKVHLFWLITKNLFKKNNNLTTRILFLEKKQYLCKRKDLRIEIWKN